MIWIVISMIVVLVFILLSKIYITFNYIYKQKKQVLNITVSFYDIRLLKKEINMVKEDQDHLLAYLSVESFSLKVKEMIDNLDTFRSIFDLLISKINIQQLNWTTEAGTGEAAQTGMASGALWAVKGVLIGFIMEKGNMLQKPNIQIIPNYQMRIIQSQMDCIVSIRVGKAIYAFLKLMRLISSKEEVFI